MTAGTPTQIMGTWMAPTVLVGTDLVLVDDIAASVAGFGQRYLHHVYAPTELAICATAGNPNAHRLAARFAAKEAVIKALRPTDGFRYSDIEIVSATDGSPTVALHGAIGEHAARLGIATSSISLTHDGDYAAATYVAIATTQSQEGTQ